jgi:DNA-binding CsgD family transcriptional regulator
MDYGRFTSGDVLALWKLEAELRPLDTDSEHRAKLLLVKLAQIIGAATATACCVHLDGAGVHRMEFVIHHGPVDPRRLEAERLTLGVSVLRGNRLENSPGGVVTCMEEECLANAGDRLLSISPEERTPRSLLGHSIYAARILSDARRALCLSLHRNPEDKPFNAKDLAVVEVIQRIEASRVPAAENDAYQRLTDHQREVAELLCDGLLEKEVAARLGISIHSVHSTVKSIYRALGVNSRYELLAERFQQRRPVALDSPKVQAIQQRSDNANLLGATSVISAGALQVGSDRREVST